MKALKIKNSWLSDSDLRLDASFHLSEGPLTKLKLAKAPFKLTTLNNECEQLFSGNIFKRTYVEKPESGWPYITGSDMVKANIDSGKYISKKYTPQADQLRIKKDWILISCSGTLGNCIYTTEDFEGRIGTHDLIRAIPNEASTKSGYLYAYLASKYGYGLLTQSSYGGVIKHIEPHHIKDLPIPVLPMKIQEAIHDKITHASRLRVKANSLLQEATSFFTELRIDYNYGISIYKSVPIDALSNNNRRFDSSYTILSGLVQDSIQSKRLEFVTIGSQSDGIFIGPRSRRNYVDQGVPFLSTSAMQKANPTRVDKFVSKKISEGFIVDEGWILTTRSGTLGDSVYVLPCMSKYAVSEDAIRIVVRKDAKISNWYLFAFLKSSIGKNSLVSGSYGSVIQHLNENYIGDIKVPLYDKDTVQMIEKKIQTHLEFINRSILLENEAVTFVEKEIESWQK